MRPLTEEESGQKVNRKSNEGKEFRKGLLRNL